MTAFSLDSLLALGFLLGLAMRWKPTILRRFQRSSRSVSLLSSSPVGAFWGLGHTLALLIAAVGVLLLRYQLTDRIAHVFELCVGIMLVFLGADVLRTLVRGGGSYTHEHTAAAPHSHADGWRFSTAPRWDGPRA
jgi:hypothetical protein